MQSYKKIYHKVALRRRKESLARGESLDKPRARASADLMRKQMSVDPSDVRLDDKPDVKVRRKQNNLTFTSVTYI